MGQECTSSAVQCAAALTSGLSVLGKRTTGVQLERPAHFAEIAPSCEPVRPALLTLGDRADAQIGAEA